MVGIRKCGNQCSPQLGPVGSEHDGAAQGRRGGGRELRGEATRRQYRRTDPRTPTQRGPLRPQSWHRPHHGHRG